MISTVNGIVSEKLVDYLIVEVSDIGYGVFVTYEDFNQLNAGDKTKLYIYEHIRENSHDLFGFSKMDTKQLFEQLINVNGVGPKMAVSILALGKSNEVRSAISEGNTRFLQMANGVGKRVAERVVVDLKDKVGLVSKDNATSFLTSDNASKDEAIQALISLGYNLNDANEALKEIDKDLATEERIKQALKRI